ncbi:MAG: hypothetical protein QM682_10035 [Paracoccus sp. (in: a-proteobacteria)]|uniref:hypothetical protein n=1 Tax=Paracoccus sp. TaxID=267 RepID=UPI0039E51C57
MSYFSARCDTDAELHTIEGLLCVLDDAALNHLTQDETPMASGIINLIQVVADRVKKARELHMAETDAQRAEQAEESPIAAMHREITALHALLNGDHGLTEDEADQASSRLAGLANAIAELPARNADDMLRKIMGQTANGDHDIGDGPHAEAIWAEARALVA